MNTTTPSPRLSLFAICERVESLDAGRLNLIGVTDMVTIYSPHSEPPAEMPHEMLIVIGVFAQTQNWRASVRLTMQVPGAAEIEIGTHDMGWIGNQYRGRWVTVLECEFERTGVHWLNAYVDGDLCGRLPLWVRHERELVH